MCIGVYITPDQIDGYGSPIISTVILVIIKKKKRQEKIEERL